MNAPLAQDWRLTITTLAMAGCVVAVFVLFPANNLLVIAGVLAVPAFLIAAGRYPELFLLGCAFMPQWKTVWPLDRFDGVGDLTLVMLLGLLVGVFWRFLRHIGRLEKENFSQLFRGQWLVLSAYILFSAVVLASYSYTSAPHYGGVKLARFLLIGTLLLISGIILIRDESEFRRVSLLFVLAACVTALQLVLHLEHRSITAENDITRIGAGWLLGMSILLLFGYPLLRTPRRNLFLIIAALPLLSAGLIASAARGPIVSLFISLPLTVFWFSKNRFSARKIGVALLLVVSCVGSFAFLRHLDPDKYNSKLGEMIQLSHGGSTSGSASKRLPYYSRTMAAIPDHFWLGQGIGSWSVFYYGRDMREYPHNLFLETMFEEGLMGQSLLLLFLCSLGVATYGMLKTTKLQYGVLAGLLIYCVCGSMFSGDLDDNRILWLWAGITMAICRNAYLQGRRERLLARYNKDKDMDSFVPSVGTTGPSIFVRPQTVKG